MNSVFCLQLFIQLLVQDGYKVIAQYNDNTSQAAVGTKTTRDKDSYVAFATSLDKVTIEVLQARDYSRTNMQCKINGKSVYVYMTFIEVPRP